MNDKNRFILITIIDFFLIGTLCFSLGNMLVTGECTILTGIVNTIIAIMWVLYGWFVYSNIHKINKIIKEMR